MDDSYRYVRVEERADRILADDCALTAYGRFVAAQLRRRRGRRVLRWLRALARVALVAGAAFLSAGILLGPVPSPAPAAPTAPRSRE